MTDRWKALEARVGELEARLDAIEPDDLGSPSRRADTPATVDEAAPDALPDAFWVLNELARRHDRPAVTFGGTVDVASHGVVQWQYGRDSATLLEQDWSELAPVLDALAHPVRLRLLQLIMNGTTATAELADADELGTTGQVHHHLRALIAAGWLRSPRRGHYEVVADRIVPLLIILLAADRP